MQQEHYAKPVQAAKQRRLTFADGLFFLLMAGIIATAAVLRGPDVLVGYNLVSCETLAKHIQMRCENPPAPTAPAPTSAIEINTGGSGGGGSQPTSSSGAGSTLPDCATIADSTTACAWRSQPPTVEQAAPTPAAEAESPSVVECWAGSFYTCEELAEMGDERATEAIEATDQFLDTASLPTADPAFVQYATEACAAAAAKSPLCPPVTP